MTKDTVNGRSSSLFRYIGLLASVWLFVAPILLSASLNWVWPALVLQSQTQSVSRATGGPIILLALLIYGLVVLVVGISFIVAMSVVLTLFVYVLVKPLRPLRAEEVEDPELYDVLPPESPSKRLAVMGIVFVALNLPFLGTAGLQGHSLLVHITTIPVIVFTVCFIEWMHRNREKSRFLDLYGDDSRRPPSINRRRPQPTPNLDIQVRERSQGPEIRVAPKPRRGSDN